MIVQIASYGLVTTTSLSIYTNTPDADETEITSRADVGGDLDSTYFHLYSADDATIYTFWMEVDASGNQPTQMGLTNTTIVSVPISADDTQATIDGALVTAIGGESDFGASGTNPVTVVCAANGAASLARQGTKSKEMGFTFSNSVKGITALPAPGAGSQNFMRVQGYVQDAKEVSTGNNFERIEFSRNLVDMIVPETQILRIWEN